MFTIKEPKIMNIKVLFALIFLSQFNSKDQLGKNVILFLLFLHQYCMQSLVIRSLKFMEMTKKNLLLWKICQDHIIMLNKQSKIILRF